VISEMGTANESFMKLHILDSFDLLPSRYQEDFASNSVSSFDSGLEWFRLLTKCSLGQEEKPRLFIAENDTGNRVLLPVCLRKSTLGNTQVDSLVNFYSTFYTPILPSTGHEELLKHLFIKLRNTAPSPIKLSFYPMDPDGHAFSALLGALREAGLIPFRYFCFGNWYLPRDGMSWEQYLQTRTKKMRSNIKRMEKKFADAQGRIELVTTEGPSLDAAITAYNQVYNSSWKQPEPFPDFVPNLIRMASTAGWLRLGVAYLGETPVAAQLWLVCHGKAYIYKVAYDEKFASFSPGTVLTAYLLRHVLENESISEVDYLVGDDPYKKTWMSYRRERWGIVAYNPSTLMGLIGIAWQVAGIARKKMLGALPQLKYKITASS